MNYKKQVFNIFGFILLNVGLVFMTQYVLGTGKCCSCDKSCGGGDDDTTCTLCTTTPATTKSSDSTCKDLTKSQLTSTEQTTVKGCCDSDKAYATILTSVGQNLTKCKACNPSACVSFDNAVANGGTLISSGKDALRAAAQLISNRQRTNPSATPTSFFDKKGNFLIRGANEGDTLPPSSATLPNARPQDSGPAAQLGMGNRGSVGSSSGGSSGLGALGGDVGDSATETAAKANRGVAGSDQSGASVGVTSGAGAVYGVGGKAGSGNNSNGMYGEGRQDSDLSGVTADVPQSVTTFQQGSNTATSVIFLSDDPEDYFTRMNLNDSLFKVIHDRYQSVVMHGFRGTMPVKAAPPAVQSPVPLVSPSISGF